jgi:signal transduction histidine kinase
LRQCFAMRMYEMDLKTKQCRPIVFQVGSRPIDTFSVAHALIRPYKGGIIFCDEAHGVFEIKEGSLIANLIISLKPGGGGFGEFVLADDRYMFLQHGGILPNFTFENKNGKWTQIPHLLDSSIWLSIVYNKTDQTYWVSFKNKLIHYDKEFRNIKTYSRADGYKGFNLKMMIDNDGNLWFVNLAKQLGRLNPVSGIFTIIPETEGYHKQDYTWLAPMAKDIRGDLYFGIGWNERIAEPDWGLDRVYPQRYSAINTTSVYFRSVIINQKSFPLSIGVNSLQELSLRYNQNTIRIETGAIDFYSKGKNQLRYKLEENGKEQEWQYTTDYTIRYEGLHPGSYRLVIQASNAGNEFNGPEKILTININPPFWETWWFRILSIIAMIVVVYAIVQERSRNLKKQNNQLEEKVMVRTKELKHSLEELKATQAQLIQSEKMASLGELTAGIAHEIQNPLNFVNNFSEVNRELIDEMEQEMDKGNLADAKAIAKDIKDNEEKINHHGKRADAIVKGMLQHSQTSTGKKELTDINKLADEYLRLAYHGLRAKDKSFNATMKTDFDESIGNINIIPQDIGRVILNLINNAFYAVTEKKNTSTGLPAGQAGSVLNKETYEPTVSVSAKKAGDKILISVKDNGNGIPQKIVDKIFQPFFTTKPTGQGTGLGLSLSYDIIKAHGGELKVENKESEGAEFIVELPIK